MKPAKKVFTKLLMNNWGGISHQVMEFNEYVNLFSGKSGSGKSTVMDAIQVVLYGSISSSFLNKAADDSRNRRSVFSYLEGAQKDGTANREGKDFCSQIVLELEDTGTHITTCIGAVFEVGKNDRDVRKYSFFSHSGRIPEDEYLTKEGVPYTIERVRNLTEMRKQSSDNRGPGDVNRMYPSREAYLNTVYDIVFGYVEAGRMMTMEKSAIALRMTNGTGQFIRDYMFPKSREDTVSTISEQLGAYREIKERVEDLETRIRMLDGIREDNKTLTATRTEKLHTEQLLKYVEIEGCTRRLAQRQQELESLQQEQQDKEEKQIRLQDAISCYNSELVEVEAALKASDYGQKEKELEAARDVIRHLSVSSRQWREILNGLKRWEEDEEVSAYVSNPALQLIDEIQNGTATAAQIEKLKQYLGEALSNINEELDEINARIAQTSADLKEKRDMAEDLRNDRKPYRKDLRQVRSELQKTLRAQYGRPVRVDIFADLFDITDERWRNAIEGRLGRIKYALVTEPAQAMDAARAFRRMRDMPGISRISLIDTDAIERDEPTALPGSLYEAVQAKEPYVDLCLKRYLGRIIKCEDVEELHEVADGVTPDGYSYSNYMFRHLNRDDYEKYACIGTKVSKTKLKELEEDIYDLEETLVTDRQLQSGLKNAQDFERLSQTSDQLLSLAGASRELEQYYQKEEQLQAEIKELKEGTMTASLTRRKEELERQIKESGDSLKEIQDAIVEFVKVQGKVEQDVSALTHRLEELTAENGQNEELQAEAVQVLDIQSEATFRRKKTEELEKLAVREQDENDVLIGDRNLFNRAYPSYGFTGVERDNEGYDHVLEQCRQDFEPKYKAEFEKQYDLVYHTLRDNVIAQIHGEIKAAYRHRREINRMLERIKFSDSIYQIDIRPAQNENGQFYDMLMAEELDSKVVDDAGVEGQMSLGEDSFYQKYERQIQLLTDKFMPPKAEDAVSQAAHRQQMERYVDYRNYLDFVMYEQVEDEKGNRKRIPVDEMAGRDSGGEGQNPKYVALLAGFAMLYMQQSNRDSKIRLVLLDEAFSKMDKERSEVCLRYARELELQLIVCVPDERLQSLIRNVDSVYGFRRYRNQISMMHIDKGAYLDMIEGDESADEDEADEEYADPVAGTVADR